MSPSLKQMKARKNISKALRLKLKEKYNGKCGYCSTPLTGKFHIDHINPFIAGGSCEEGNLLAVCISCNLQKGGRGLEEFREFLHDKLYQLSLVANYEVAKRYRLIKEIQKVIIFEFERIQMKAEMENDLKNGFSDRYVHKTNFYDVNGSEDA